MSLHRTQLEELTRAIREANEVAYSHDEWLELVYRAAIDIHKREQDTTNKERWTLLEEDPTERAIFNNAIKLFGPLGAVANTLYIWVKGAPQEGSYAKMLAIMHNELCKIHNGTL